MNSSSLFRIPSSIFTIVLLLMTLGLQYLLYPLFGSFDWALSSLAVALCAWQGGWLSGFMATALFAGSGLVLFTIPHWADPEGGWRGLLTVIFFVGVGLLLSVLIEKMRSGREAFSLSLNQSKAALASLSEKERKISESNERLRSFDRLKSRFLVNFSHGLRTPLTLILGYSQEALAIQSEGPMRTALQGIQRNAWILLEQINNLLEATKLESGAVSPTYNEVDLAKVVHRATVHFDAVARNKNCDFTVDMPSSAVVQTDAEIVQRILAVLLSNAFKFTPNGGKVRCTLRSPLEKSAPGHARFFILEVADSGPGVPEAYTKIIFGNYIEGNESWVQNLTGAGLGLVIAKGFADILGGKIQVGRAPEGGALFTVEIPVFAPPGVSVGRVSSEFFQEPALPVAAALSRHLEDQISLSKNESAASGKRPVVLVVDDSIDMLEYLTRSFSAAFQIVTALDGQAGLAKAKAFHPDLIISDMMMPVTSGEKLLREVRTTPGLESIPFIFLTAKADERVILQMLREGAQDYLVKPFSPEQLLAKSWNLIHARKPESPQPESAL